MPAKAAEYRLALETNRDMEAIWLYTQEEWGLEQANLHIDKLTATFENLAANPQLGTACSYIRQGYRRAESGRHMIYFRITDYGIAVIRVLHTRMDAPRHFGDTNAERE
ncbi:MAG: toxin ParE1/3/4 [Gammaproteobacteria bacterium]|jgi:toxin ParE1/3/4